MEALGPLNIVLLMKRPVYFSIKNANHQWIASFKFDPQITLKVEDNLYDDLIVAPPRMIIYRSIVKN